MLVGAARFTRSLAAAAVLVLAAACSADTGTPSPAAVDACADATKVFAIPSPAWQQGETLTPPAGDAVARLLDEAVPGFRPALPQLDGWAQRPMFLVPAQGAVSAVDPSRVVMYATSPRGAAAPQPVPFEATIAADGASVTLKGRDPLLTDARDLVLAIPRGAFTGGAPLPACGADGRPHPAYAAARAALPAGADLALAIPFRRATTPLALPKLWDRLAARPALTVSRVETKPPASFGVAPGVEAKLDPRIAVGLLDLPSYVDDAGVLQLDAEGAPRAIGVTRPGFLVALPATGTGPFPVVLFQHGGGGDKTSALGLAGPLADAGFALVAIDLPHHGDRAKEPGGSGLDFVDIAAPLKTRDNFRQASADHMAVLTGLGALDAALAPLFGGAKVLDPQRAFYMGISLGGITGSLTFASAKTLRGAALFVGGAGFGDMVSGGLFSLLAGGIRSREAPDRDALLVALEALLDGADPLAYAQRVEDRAARPRPVVLFQAVADAVVSARASDQWARAFGASLARPFEHEVTGMPVVALPAKDTFAWAGGAERATRVLVQAPMKEIPPLEHHGALVAQGYAQRMVARCFATVLSTGSCEVVDTGFAAR